MQQSLNAKRGLNQKKEPTSCPLCHQDSIIEMETSSEKIYYSCKNDACKFISWDKPFDQKCPKCDNQFLIEVDVDGEPVYQCPNSNCSFEVNVADADEKFSSISEDVSEKAEIEKPKKKKKRKKRVRKVMVRRKS
ncbi:DNA topoisomerase I [Candidatus Magnetomorum sp. HK-1]|nr:DNA topoisomerase I [Candidatus Magnetomorum sp. HK-1]